jgi:hypothetical protein
MGVAGTDSNTGGSPCPDGKPIPRCGRATKSPDGRAAEQALSTTLAQAMPDQMHDRATAIGSVDTPRGDANQPVGENGPRTALGTTPTPA